MNTLTQFAPDRRNQPAADFNIEDYLEARRQDPNFSMVEIGHGGVPVAFNEPKFFTGTRTYTGVEAWLRDPKHCKRARVARLLENHASDNITFIQNDLGGEVIREDGESEKDSYYSGDYKPACELPKAAASEVLLSNVFGDPHVAWPPGSTRNLLAEAKRLIKPDGVVVARETITPEYAQLTPLALAEVGLQALKRFYFIMKNEPTWQKLEAVYDGEPSTIDHVRKGFYLFMAKQD